MIRALENIRDNVTYPSQIGTTMLSSRLQGTKGRCTVTELSPVQCIMVIPYSESRKFSL